MPLSTLAYLGLSGAREQLLGPVLMTCGCEGYIRYMYAGRASAVSNGRNRFHARYASEFGFLIGGLAFRVLVVVLLLSCGEGISRVDTSALYHLTNHLCRLLDGVAKNFT